MDRTTSSSTKEFFLFFFYFFIFLFFFGGSSPTPSVLRTEYSVQQMEFAASEARRTPVDSPTDSQRESAARLDASAER
ncbi:hypothetical protein CPSG_04505 [Coccidioides posadasii str. Silveira]|uniref:Uncharacterized protein n=1 Tax=Coccidioides posadasii (strain RMSCC 757 / Silveira) TaxID=443226 RepID=E9D4G6_COCPS|nr:hypothetical protein CPSG_04505 [Coccidioides posadasii str. Silveira]